MIHLWCLFDETSERNGKTKRIASLNPLPHMSRYQVTYLPYLWTNATRTFSLSPVTQIQWKWVILLLNLFRRTPCPPILYLCFLINVLYSPVNYIYKKKKETIKTDEITEVSAERIPFEILQHNRIKVHFPWDNYQSSTYSY